MPSPEPGLPQIPGRVQPLIAGLVAASLLAMAGWYVVNGGLSGGLVHHDHPPAATAAFTVDLNTAPAVELAQLPGLGPATAARIVEHRREHGLFTSPESLLAVPGIGPVTLEAIRPHLRAADPRPEAP